MGVAKGALGPWSILCRQPISPTLQKGHTAVERTWWRHHQNANRAFGNLSVILAPFGTVFGYLWLKTPGNPACAARAAPRVRAKWLWLVVVCVLNPAVGCTTKVVAWPGARKWKRWPIDRDTVTHSTLTFWMEHKSRATKTEPERHKAICFCISCITLKLLHLRFKFRPRKVMENKPWS